MATTPNTTMGTVPGTTAGAGALAPAPETLTIDRRDLRLFIRQEARDTAAIQALDRVIDSTLFGEDRSPLCHAWAMLQRVWRDDTEMVIRRGGMLHIGAAV